MNREDALKQVEDFGRELDAIRRRVPKDVRQYTDTCGVTYSECPCAYSDDMSRAMSMDMFRMATTVGGKHPGLDEKLRSWSEKMRKMNFRLLRMMDDHEGDRPMKPWKFKASMRFASDIRDTMMDVLNETDELKDFLDQCRLWAVRVIYMNTWAYCLEAKEDIERLRTESQMEISGLNSEMTKMMSVLCLVREQLVDLLIQVQVDTKDYGYIMNKLEVFDRISHDIMNG